MKQRPAPWTAAKLVEARHPGTLGWKFRLWFVGRGRGTEQIDCPGARDPIVAPLGFLCNHLDADVRPPGIPEAIPWPKTMPGLTSRLIRELTAEKRSAKLRAQAWEPSSIDDDHPLDPREQLLYTIDDLVILPALDKNPPQPVPLLLWYAKRAETAAKAEILYALTAWKYGAASRDCLICGRAFLRAKSYNGLLCTLCRRLNTYQQARLAELKAPVRQALAVQVYRTRQNGLAFTDWPKPAKGARHDRVAHAAK
jgi:hypothetical protein